MSTKPRHNVKSIAIIGAGPAGIATAKYLLAEKAFEKIDIFEQRSTVGGVWNYSPDSPRGTINIPQVDPDQPVEEPVWRSSHANHALGLVPKKEATFVSPMYDRLETNIPKSLMLYSDKTFPEDSQLFPKHETVMQYLEEYGEDIMDLVRSQIQVLDVRLHKPDAAQEYWLVKTKHLQWQHQKEARYDAIVVATGHYNVPYVPDIRGIAKWNAEYPQVISHSRSFRRPEDFKDKKVIIVGNAASGVDIGAQIGTVCKLPLLVSQRSASYLSPGAEAYKEEVPEIIDFLPSTSCPRAVRFADGRIEQDIDVIVFCTGYLYSYPFLGSLNPPIVSGGKRVQHVYRHIFYNDQPTLAFVGLPQKIIPFIIAEAQAAVVSRVWSGRLDLPSQEEMYLWEDSIIAERGAGKGFHTLMFPSDVDYLDDLRNWALEARNMAETGGRGKLPLKWGDKERWARERFPAIKKAFAQKGEGRHKVRTMEELGFDFDVWRREIAGARSLL
ncbi:MAG: hypothetical protein M1830_009988 [Pleopsidium flavum]|nr:MAG: hypothetical protein M1830_009988 [Pleopsidium flavum]